MTLCWRTSLFLKFGVHDLFWFKDHIKYVDPTALIFLFFFPFRQYFHSFFCTKCVKFSFSCSCHFLQLYQNSWANTTLYPGLSAVIPCSVNPFLSRVWTRLRHCANPALQLKLSLKKNGQGDNLSPSKFRGKKLERKHKRRDLFQYRNCKVKQNMESIFYRMFKVHSKVTFQSHSTEHVSWTRLANENENENVWVSECQSESEKNNTEEEQCIYQEETDEDQRKPKKITRSQVVALWKGGDVLLFLSEI